MLSYHDYQLINGMSNRFWGWGKENEEFQENFKKFGLKVTRPENIATGRNGSFLDIHAPHRHRDSQKCFSQTNQTTDHRDANDGANSTKYKILKVKDLTVGGSKVTVLNVELDCNKNVTPWCECDDEV